MQDKNTLFELGFLRHPKWDAGDQEHYRLDIGGDTYRARVVDHNGPSPYVALGRVVTPDGKVDRWRDCCSNGSVVKKIRERAEQLYKEWRSEQDLDGFQKMRKLGIGSKKMDGGEWKPEQYLQPPFENTVALYDDDLNFEAIGVF